MNPGTANSDLYWTLKAAFGTNDTNSIPSLANCALDILNLVHSINEHPHAPKPRATKAASLWQWLRKTKEHHKWGGSAKQGYQVKAKGVVNNVQFGWLNKRCSTHAHFVNSRKKTEHLESLSATKQYSSSILCLFLELSHAQYIQSQATCRYERGIIFLIGKGWAPCFEERNVCAFSPNYTTVCILN